MNEYSICIFRIEQLIEARGAIEEALDFKPWNSEIWTIPEKIFGDGRDFDRADLCAAVQDLVDLDLQSQTATIYRVNDEASECRNEAGMGPEAAVDKSNQCSPLVAN